MEYGGREGQKYLSRASWSWTLATSTPCGSSSDPSSARAALTLLLFILGIYSQHNAQILVGFNIRLEFTV